MVIDTNDYNLNITRYVERKSQEKVLVSGTSDGAVARKRIGGFHTAEERLIAVLKREEILS